MNKLFVESSGFTHKLADFLDDEAYARFQRELMGNPERGKLMHGCGGLRKIRVAAPKRQKGKRGGGRSSTCTCRRQIGFFSWTSTPRVRRRIWRRLRRRY